MAAAQFSDDAYNKRIQGSAAGTLVGNWFEERVLREATSEGRAVAQRHIPRSGLLRDFTKVPAAGPRRLDNTFERVYGPKVTVPHSPSSLAIGGYSQVCVPKIGPREKIRQTEKEQLIGDMVDREEADFAARFNLRTFETTNRVDFAKPDEALAERASHLKDSCKSELMHGPHPDRLIGLGNSGLDVNTHAHYSNVEQVTHARMCLGDPTLRTDIKASAATGVKCFGKSAEFSKPILHFIRGAAKDEELESLFRSLAATRPTRHLTGSQPLSVPFAEVPSLATLKSTVHAQIQQVWGPSGYVILRQRLFESSDHEGFVQKPAVKAIFRDELGLTQEQVSDRGLEAYLLQLITMKRAELRVGTLMTSLRPAPPQQDKRRMVEAFRALDPVAGNVRLGSWLERLGDSELRGVVATAFGAQGDEAAVADTLVSESVFVELLSDLAALMDIHSILD